MDVAVAVAAAEVRAVGEKLIEEGGLDGEGGIEVGDVLVFYHLNDDTGKVGCRETLLQLDDVFGIDIHIII